MIQCLGFLFGWLIMAVRSPKPCGHPGCSLLVYDGTGYCAKHKPEPWKKRPGSAKRVTGRRLQRMRHELFSDNPLCAECLRQGRVTPADERDHIIPLFEGGKDEPDNIQGLCKSCHAEKTARESLRARKGGGG